MVAKNGCRLRAEDSPVQSLPGKQEVTARSPSTSLGMASETLGSTSPGLCGSVPWKKVSYCDGCPLQEAPLHPWEWPHKPWVRLHLDYAGLFLGKMFLIVMDAHSKWMEAFPMNTSTSSANIEILRIAFATHGLPEIVVTDNGSNFASKEFGVWRFPQTERDPSHQNSTLPPSV